MNKLRLPAHYGFTELFEISPKKFGGPAIFFMIMDELEAESKETPGKGFFNNRISLLTAYGEGRMFGLMVGLTAAMDRLNSEHDTIFMHLDGWNGCVLPCFIVFDEVDPISTPWLPGCDYLWTAQRARKRGLANCMLCQVGVRAANDPIPEAAAFWAKYFERLRAADKDAEFDEE